ncbi:hypothetical protein GPJ56_004913 [Histomonas meleagridis]|uniref:uncharacterized protein n=1 Tax=Histomonas meleagridis TaxID=135588 RepID=UPI00355A447F|nr:hypothetical protein GPJ56_004913 [Histomonas meleagridis]KAH0806301.1 hypothetical protein GO595_000989 [Histomonas meleagridis]
METLPTDPSTRGLVFGLADSGKTTFSFEYAEAILKENPESVCLILAQKPKSKRKPIKLEFDETFDRMLFKWITDRASLLFTISQLHLHIEQPLELVIVEDILEVANTSQAQALIANLINALSVFPGCRLLVTMTPKPDSNISLFRHFFTHYVNTCGENRHFGRFYKCVHKAKYELETSLNIA